jgi:secreted PhoX family phosphatase
MIFPAGSNRNVAPSATISGGATRLHSPDGIAIDSSGNIYVANDGSDYGGVDSITVYPPGSNGNIAPIGTVRGFSTGLTQPALVALSPGP